MDQERARQDAATPSGDARRLAHDLRNVLASMQGIAIRIERALDPADAALAGELALAIEHAGSLARELLEARPHAASPRLVARCSIAGALIQSRPLLQRVAAPVPLLLAVDEADGCVALGREAIERIAINLVRNARNASGPTGSIAVRSIRTTDGDGRPWDTLQVDNAVDPAHDSGGWSRVDHDAIRPGLGLTIVCELTASADGHVQLWRCDDARVRVCCAFPVFEP